MDKSYKKTTIASNVLMSLVAAMPIADANAHLINDDVQLSESSTVPNYTSGNTKKSIENNISVTVPKYTEWTNSLEKRFDKLLMKEALDEEMTADELSEYRELCSARSIYQSTRSEDEIFADLKLEKLTKTVLDALSEYNSYASSYQR